MRRESWAAPVPLGPPRTGGAFLITPTARLPASLAKTLPKGSRGHVTSVSNPETEWNIFSDCSLILFLRGCEASCVGAGTLHPSQRGTEGGGARASDQRWGGSSGQIRDPGDRGFSVSASLDANSPSLMALALRLRAEDHFSPPL